MRSGVLWCVALAASAAAQDQPAGETQPLFRTKTRLVEVTIQGTWSNGSAAGDLIAGDLRLFDNNREQVISTFERVQGSALEAKRTGRTGPLDRRAERLSIILLDALNTEWSDQIYARRAAARVLEQIPSGERIAIFVLGDGLRLLHDFSSDSASLKALAQRFSGVAPRDELDSAANPLSAKFSYSDLLRSKGPSSGAEAAFRQRRRILETLEALTAIAHLVRRAPGEKNLLWLSAGFPLRFDTSGAAGDGGLGAESFHAETARTTRELSAANVTMYPIDARGLSLSVRAHINIDTMKELADQTGGKAYYNSNDLASMVRLALEDSRNGYVLTYAPPDLQDDGKYHSIRLRTDRRGVRLRYRPGYYAETPEEAKR